MSALAELRICLHVLLTIVPLLFQQSDRAVLVLVKTAVHTAAAMKEGAAALKKEMAGIKISDIENNMDDMSDLLEDSNEIFEVFVALTAKGLIVHEKNATRIAGFVASLL